MKVTYLASRYTILFQIWLSTSLLRKFLLIMVEQHHVPWMGTLITSGAGVVVHILIMQLTLGGEWTWDRLILWLKLLLLTDCAVKIAPAL